MSSEKPDDEEFKKLLEPDPQKSELTDLAELNIWLMRTSRAREAVLLDKLEKQALIIRRWVWWANFWLAMLVIVSAQFLVFVWFHRK